MPIAPADAETMAFEQRIHQEFTPNASPEQDLVYAEIPVEKLPDPKPQKKPAAVALSSDTAEQGAAENSQDQQAQQPAEAGAPPRYTGGGAPAEWMAAAGIAKSDWAYVDYIASKESGWNPNATNASSGACGLIQALPCSKVPGNGYDPVDNLRWASGYAKDRYGSWAAAYQFWTANHWW
nr:transglycosylase SLT domain-containing protein [Leucobacter edaphi]